MKLTYIIAGENRFPKCNDCGKVFDLDNSQDDCYQFSRGNHYGLGCNEQEKGE
jgi:hypothetical protein